MTSIDHSRGAAPIHRGDLPPAQPYPPARPRRRVELAEILALTDALVEGGFPVPGGVVEKVQERSDAITSAMRSDDKWFGVDLLELPAAEVAERFRQHALDRAATTAMREAVTPFEHRLAAAAAAALNDGADKIIHAMRRSFDPATKLIEAAAAAGLRPDTTPEQIAESGSDAAVKTFRALAPAVGTLDRIAGLRLQLADVGGVGPATSPDIMANLIGGPLTRTDLEAAERVWRADTQVVQHETPLGGSHLARVPRNRLGGRWLAVVVAGYRPRLNTGTEAHAIVTNH